MIAAYRRWTRPGRPYPAPAPEPARVEPLPMSWGDLDRAPSPRKPDQIVFGDWTPSSPWDAPAGWDKSTCPACDVTWYGPMPCWCCGAPAEPP